MDKLRKITITCPEDGCNHEIHGTLAQIVIESCKHYGEIHNG